MEMEVINLISLLLSYYWILIVTVGVIVIIIWNFLTKQDKRVVEFIERFNGPLSLPILGSSLAFWKPNHEIIPQFDKFAKKYGPAYRLWIGYQPVVVLSGAAEIEKVLSPMNHINKARTYKFLQSWLGQGLITSNGRLWHQRRKILTPAFHFKILEEFIHVFNEQGNILVNILEDKKCNGDAGYFDICPYVSRCALDIICETAMGKKVGAQEGCEEEYVNSVYGFGDLILQRFLAPWLQPEVLWNLSGNGKLEKKYIKVLHGFTNKVISERKLERLKNKKENLSYKPVEDDDTGLYTKKRRAFLDLLLDIAETDKSLSDTDIREETDTFMIAGHHTTGTNMAWVICTLAYFTEHQKKVQEELDEIFGDDKEREITSSDVAKMKYLECCIKETLRLYPSAPFFVRHQTEDCDLGNGLIIPKGTDTWISSYIVHRDAKAFPDPLAFKPERFYAENCIGRHPYAYIPFSAGPRNCIGQKFALLEEKIILAKLLLNFRFETLQNPEEIRSALELVLKPMDGIHVKISRRER